MKSRKILPIVIFATLSGTPVPGQTGFGSLAQYFPQFAVGGTAQTLLTLNNTSGQAIQVDAELILSDGSNLEQRQVQLDPGESRTETFEQPDLATTNGWMKLSQHRIRGRQSRSRQEQPAQLPDLQSGGTAAVVK